MAHICIVNIFVGNNQAKSKLSTSILYDCICKLNNTFTLRIKLRLANKWFLKDFAKLENFNLKLVKYDIFCQLSFY